MLPATPVGVFHAALVAALVVEVATLAFPPSCNPCPEDPWSVPMVRESMVAFDAPLAWDLS